MGLDHTTAFPTFWMRTQVCVCVCTRRFGGDGPGRTSIPSTETRPTSCCRRHWSYTRAVLYSAAVARVKRTFTRSEQVDETRAAKQKIKNVFGEKRIANNDGRNKSNTSDVTRYCGEARAWTYTDSADRQVYYPSTTTTTDDGRRVKCVSGECKREISRRVKRRRSLFLERFVPRATAVQAEEKTKCRRRRRRIDIRDPAAGCPVFFSSFLSFFFSFFFILFSPRLSTQSPTKHTNTKL